MSAPSDPDVSCRFAIESPYDPEARLRFRMNRNRKTAATTNKAVAANTPNAMPTADPALRPDSGVGARSEDCVGERIVGVEGVERLAADEPAGGMEVVALDPGVDCCGSEDWVFDGDWSATEVPALSVDAELESWDDCDALPSEDVRVDWPEEEVSDCADGVGDCVSGEEGDCAGEDVDDVVVVVVVAADVLLLVRHAFFAWPGGVPPWPGGTSLPDSQSSRTERMTVGEAIKPNKGNVVATEATVSAGAVDVTAKG